MSRGGNRGPEWGGVLIAFQVSALEAHSGLCIPRDFLAELLAVLLLVMLCDQFVQLQTFVIHKTEVSMGTWPAHH